MPAGESLPPAPPRVDDPSATHRDSLCERAAAYAAAELRERGFADVVPPTSLDFAVSTNGQRTRRVADIRPRKDSGPAGAEAPGAGGQAADAGPQDAEAGPQAFTITLTWAYYAAMSWEEFTVAVRHELVHAVEYVEHGSFSHGPRFRQYAGAFDTVVDPAELVPDVLDRVAHRYRLECEGCAFDAVRDKASKVVKRPDDRRCPDCGGGIRVRHLDSGRSWTTASGYRTARAAVERAEDVTW